MNYIVSEDSRSGKAFWCVVQHTFGLEFRIKDTEGNGNFATLMDIVLEMMIECKLTEQDRIIICYDRLDLNTSQYPLIQKALEKYPCKTYVSNYGSVELLFLSFKRLVGWCGAISEECRKALRALLIANIFDNYDSAVGDAKNPGIFMRKPDVSDIDKEKYSWVVTKFDVDKCNPDVQPYLMTKQMKGCQYSTVEQFVAALLEDITSNTGFEIAKKNIKECWFKSCCYDKNVNQRVVYWKSLAKKCQSYNWNALPNERTGLRDSGLTGKQKLNILFSESSFMTCFSDKNGNVCSVYEAFGITPAQIDHTYNQAQMHSLVQPLVSESPPHFATWGHLKFIPEESGATSEFIKPKGQWVIEYVNMETTPLKKNQVFELLDSSGNVHQCKLIYTSEWVLRVFNGTEWVEPKPSKYWPYAFVRIPPNQ